MTAELRPPGTGYSVNPGMRVYRARYEVPTDLLGTEDMRLSLAEAARRAVREVLDEQSINPHTLTLQVASPSIGRTVVEAEANTGFGYVEGTIGALLTRMDQKERDLHGMIRAADDRAAEDVVRVARTRVLARPRWWWPFLTRAAVREALR